MLLIWFYLATLVKAAELNSLQYTGLKGRIPIKNAYEKLLGSSSYQQLSRVTSYFQSVALPEKPANFEIATLLCPHRPKKILFVTPNLVDSMPSAVKSTFLRYKCQCLGLLVRTSEAETFQSSNQQGFFLLCQLTVSNCKNAFRRAFGVVLKLVLVDTGCDSLSEVVFSDFEASQMILFRHPSCFVDDQCFYDSSGRCQSFSEDENELMVDSGGWIQDPSLPLDFITEYDYSLQYRLTLLTVVQPSLVEDPNERVAEDAEFDTITLTSASSPHSALTNLDALEYDIIDLFEIAGDEVID